MDNEDGYICLCVYIYNEILVIHKKEVIILKSERERYDITCMWNLKKKVHKSTYLQNKNKTIDTEKKPYSYQRWKGQTEG